ncbi:MAG: 2-phosphosulfolactate phosphatase [Alkalinema sp. CACIAM 70d]|nr:MAG: 2-phosphosulfolactate phosphatase [Alkalinema sp. CACIAM 70d]
MKLFVYHTPELTPSPCVADCAIAIDVLRATTTIATALGVGAEAVQVFSDLNRLMQVSAEWDPAKRLRAGERGGSKVEGCDFGNSPLDCTPQLMQGRRLFISTTNGTRALQKIEDCSTVLAAALINRHAIVRHLVNTQPENVWIVGAGWEGSFALEDTVCAGAIAVGVMEQLGCTLEEIAGNDELVGAVALYQQWKDNLLGLFHLASHGQRLLRLECHADLKYCSELDSLDILPIQRETGVLVSQVNHAAVATRSAVSAAQPV